MNDKRRRRRPGETAHTDLSATAMGTAGGEVIGPEVGDLEAPEPVVSHTPQYLRSLLILLVAATFFEGYDGAILALVLGSIRDTFNVAESQLGVSRAIIELGLGAAFFLARAGDSWGRRRLLLFSVLGYTVMTTLTAFSWDLWSFTAFQSVSRIFLGAEYAVALTMIVEEFPKERRARAIGTLLMFSAIGAVAVALLLLAGVADGPLEWRTLYLVGVIPLLFLAFFRRRLKETRRFQEHAESVGEEGLHVDFFEPWRRPFRRTLVLVGTIHLLRSLPLFGATSWFFYYAEREAGLGTTALYLIFIVAYGFGTIGYLVCGNLMDRIGRRPTAIAYGVIAAISSVALFQVSGPLALGLLLVVAVFFGLGMAPVLGAISTELFPTYIRNQAAAWARNIFEIAGFILGPLLVGVLGDHYTGALGSIGDTVSLLLLLFVPATWLIWRHLPETKGRELEEIEQDLGIDLAEVEEDAEVAKEAEAEEEPETPARRRVHPGVVMATAAIVLVGGGALAVGALGDITRRPEGAAERFIQAVADDDEAQIDRFGDPRIADGVFGTEDPDIERIQVGRAKGSSVPVRIELEDPERARVGRFTIRHVIGDTDEFHVVRVVLEDEGEGSDAPEVSQHTSSAPAAAWPLAIGVVLALTLLSEVVLRSLRAR